MKTSDLVWKNESASMELKVEKEEGYEFPYLSYPLLSSLGLVNHCFTTREGGVSEGIFTSLNLSFTRGDDADAVMENYRRVAQVMGTDCAHIVTSDQTHTTNVRQVYTEDGGNGITKPRPYTDVDGLITDVPGLCLATFYADCVPLYFVDPVHKAIGLSHSGWRGTVARMGQVTLERMKDAFGTRPEDVYAAIGPSICQDCYEISDEVAEQFIEEIGHEEAILINKHNGHYQLDLQKSNEIVLREAGILLEHLAITNLCTCCNGDYLFSHRKSQGKRGNLGAFLMLK